MTELEKMKRAKLYIDKLSIGINPIDDTYVTANDVVRNERISNCFKYISEVLFKQIEKENMPKKVNRLFFLPLEFRNSFEFSDSPIYGSEILRRINALVENLECKKLSSRVFFSSLVELGLIEDTVLNDGKIIRRPTDFGLSVGVITEHKIRPNGTEYFSVLYHRSAQQFILDNIDAIIDINTFKKKQYRENAPLQGKVWTHDQERRLVALFNSGVNANEIASEMQRTVSGIASKLHKLGLVESKKGYLSSFKD